MRSNESNQHIPATGKRLGSETGFQTTLLANLIYAAGAMLLTAGLLHVPADNPMKYVNRANRLVRGTDLTCRLRDDLPSIVSTKLSRGVSEINTRIDSPVSLDSLKVLLLQMRRDYEEGATNLICESLRNRASSCDCQGQTACETHATECKYPRRASNRSAVPL